MSPREVTSHWQAAGTLRHGRGGHSEGGGNPYYRLLRAYLQAYLPRTSVAAEHVVLRPGAQSPGMSK